MIIRDAMMGMIIYQKINDIKCKPGRFTNQDVDRIFHDFKRHDFSQGVDDCNMEIGFFIDVLLEEEKFTDYSVEKASEIARSVGKFCMGDFTFVNRLGRIKLHKKQYIDALILLCKAMQLDFINLAEGIDQVIYLNIHLAIKHSQLFKILESNRISSSDDLKLVITTLEEIIQRFGGFGFGGFGGFDDDLENRFKLYLSIANLLFQQEKYAKAEKTLELYDLPELIEKSGNEVYKNAYKHNMERIQHAYNCLKPFQKETTFDVDSTSWVNTCK